MRPTSVIELKRSALKKNLNYLKKRVGENVIFGSVIKGNAYGHGIDTFLPLAESCGIKHFLVFDAAEALRALQVKRLDTELIIMGMIENDHLEWAIENEIHFFVFDLDRLEKAIKAAKKVKKMAKIHLELETGLNRTGLDGQELEKAVALIHAHKDALRIEGICTHYAGAESVSNYLRIQKQIAKFHRLQQWLEQQQIKFRLRHTACSAAALTYPETTMDMVRIGISQYGFWPSKETRMHNLLRSHADDYSEGSTYTCDPLRRVLKWKSWVMSLKRVPAGEFVSYGTSYLTSKEELLAIIPVGYFHGYARNLSNAGKVLIRGKKVPVVGLVNMNMLIAEVTSIKGVKKGDEAVLIGSQKKQHISVASFAEFSNHLNYEMLARLPGDIPRIVKE